MPSDFVNDMVNDALVKAGQREAAPAEDYSTETGIDTYLHTVPVVGSMAATGLNFADGLINGEDYRRQQEVMEENQELMMEKTSLGNIPGASNIFKLAHGAGDAGAYMHDVFDYLTD